MWNKIEDWLADQIENTVAYDGKSFNLFLAIYWFSGPDAAVSPLNGLSPVRSLLTH